MTARMAGCRLCPALCASRTRIVDGIGFDKASLMVIGEAPGAREDAVGRPFIGPSGKLIRATLSELGVGDDEVFYTNVVRCHPAENRDPTVEEMDNCQGWLVEELYRVRPEVILCLGKIAQLRVMSGPDLFEVKRELGVKVVRAYHPAYILRNQNKKQAWVKHLKEVVDHDLRGLPRAAVGEPEGWSEGAPNPDSPWFAVDTETDDLQEGIGVKMVSWQTSDGKKAFIGVGYTPNFCLIPRVWFHNAKYDAPLVGVNLRDYPNWDDTMLMAYVLREQRVGLKELGPKLTGIPMDPIGQVLTGERYSSKTLKSGPDKGMVVVTAHQYKRPFSVALAEDSWDTRQYALKDAVVTSRLAQYLTGELDRIGNERLKQYYKEIEKPIVPILRDMEDTGVEIDPDVLVKIGKQLRATQRKIEAVFAGFNLNSNRDIAAILRKDGLYTLRDKTPSGEWKVDSATLLKLAGVDSREEVVKGTYIGEILAYKEAKKLESTYVTALLDRRDDGGRVHGRLNQAVADTNRLSSSEPNLQNIPAKTQLGRSIRRAFVAPRGYTIVKADYSQLEVRIFAHYTGEPVLLSAYTPGQERDVHQGVADELGIERKAAKNVLFGAIYGADAPKLAVTAGVPLAESTAFLGRLRQRLPSLGMWQARVAEWLTQQGYVETWLGWRNYYPQFWSPIRSESRAALREAANLPIQGTAAGVVKRLMIALDGSWQKCGARLLMQVHDELVFECPDNAVKSLARILQIVGARVGWDCGLVVPLVLEVETGPSWGTTKPFHG